MVVYRGGQFRRRFLTHRCLHLPIHKTGSGDPSTWSWASVGQLSRDSTWGPHSRTASWRHGSLPLDTAAARAATIHVIVLVYLISSLRVMRSMCQHRNASFPVSSIFPHFLYYKCFWNFGKAFVSFTSDVEPFINSEHKATIRAYYTSQASQSSSSLVKFYCAW